MYILLLLKLSQEEVLRYIENNPGCHLRQVKRDLNISMGTTQYALQVLEDKGIISSTKKGLYKFYFITGIFLEYEKKILQIIKCENSRKILLFIIEKKVVSQKEIVEFMKISYPSVHRHLQQLIKLGIIEEYNLEKPRGYRIKDKQFTICVMSLLKNYYSSIWLEWSNRLAELFLFVSDADEKT